MGHGQVGYKSTIVCMMGRKLGLLCLKSLIEKRYVIKHLFTHKYEPNSEIVRDDYQDFVSLARENNIPLHVVNKGEEYDIIKNEDFDFIVSCCYRHILPKEVLILPKIMPLNLHYSLLPKYKGEKPLQRALKNKEQETGMTIHKMVETVDEGEIISQARIKIDEGDTVENLYQKLYKVTPRLLIDTLKKLEI